MLGITSCMERLRRHFAFRGCYFKGRVLPSDAPAFLEGGARIDYEKTTLRYTLHLRSAFFTMWAELLHQKNPTSAHIIHLEHEIIINHASPIIMAGTPPASPMRPSPLQTSVKFDGVRFDGISESLNRAGSLDTENCLDADMYTAAVLMDHHQSLCDQSVSQVSGNFRRKPKIQYLPNLGSSSANSLVKTAECNFSASETSSNSHSNTASATTLRPLSPTTKAHVRNNIIAAPLNSQESPVMLKKGNHSNDTLQETQKMQAFKIVRSPTINPMARMRNESVGKMLQVQNQEKQAGRDLAHVGWGCFTGAATEFPAAREIPGLRQHSSFLSSAIAMRMRMSEELRSKELTDQKLSIGQQHRSGSTDTARQPWVRR